MSDDDFEGHARWRPDPVQGDAVNPAHYKPDGLPEVIDQMRLIYGDGVVSCYCLCAAFKYRQRAGLKPGQPVEQDIAKARWYEQMRLFILGRGPDPRADA